MLNVVLEPLFKSGASIKTTNQLHVRYKTIYNNYFSYTLDLVDRQKTDIKFKNFMTSTY